MRLRELAFANVTTRNGLPAGGAARFSVSESDKRFTVVRQAADSDDAYVQFELKHPWILVFRSWEANSGFVRVGLTLTDGGTCRLRVADDTTPLEPWQFMRRALEDLFFNL